MIKSDLITNVSTNSQGIYTTTYSSTERVVIAAWCNHQNASVTPAYLNGHTLVFAVRNLADDTPLETSDITIAYRYI